MNSDRLLAVAEVSSLHGWVGPAAVLAGVLLLIVALVRRSRVTLARKRRAANPSTAD
ncbi:hypothetical protein GCM10009854_32070 [Saccharopolyspora halophila]|uniref:Uncharacterized protein n=1 Tax=Saccharopolyspora halophila TaxID=405551 RepID=A0ABN3GJE1_9PSEU